MAQKKVYDKEFKVQAVKLGAERQSFIHGTVNRCP